MKSSIANSIFVLLMTGCAVGPLVNHESARTVGLSNHELIGGYGNAGYALKWNYGLTENLDFGIQYESLSIGLRAKYAFINSSAGFSLAAALGAGTSVGGSHQYADLIGSQLSGAWEPYGTFRFVHVKTDPTELKSESSSDFNFTIDSYSYNYGQMIIGSRYWIDNHWVLSGEVSKIVSFNDGASVSSSLIYGLAGGYRF